MATTGPCLRYVFVVIIQFSEYSRTNMSLCMRQCLEIKVYQVFLTPLRTQYVYFIKCHMTRKGLEHIILGCKVLI